jgi:hypothetical protein
LSKERNVVVVLNNIGDFCCVDWLKVYFGQSSLVRKTIIKIDGYVCFFVIFFVKSAGRFFFIDVLILYDRSVGEGYLILHGVFIC